MAEKRSGHFAVTKKRRRPGLKLYLMLMRVDFDRSVHDVMRESRTTIRFFLDFGMRCVGCRIGCLGGRRMQGISLRSARLSEGAARSCRIGWNIGLIRIRTGRRLPDSRAERAQSKSGTNPAGLGNCHRSRAGRSPVSTKRTCGRIFHCYLWLD
jgi:hypothetical protein